jgi:hypothetical protein
MQYILTYNEYNDCARIQRVLTTYSFSYCSPFLTNSQDTWLVWRLATSVYSEPQSAGVENHAIKIDDNIILLQRVCPMLACLACNVGSTFMSSEVGWKFKEKRMLEHLAEP